MTSNTPAFKPAARHKARKFAMQGLYAWHISRNPIIEIESHLRTENDMRKTDVGYLHELMVGVVKHVDSLDEFILPALDRRLDELDAVELAILRIGAFELLHRMDVPFRVVINEGVELAKEFGASESHKFINGVVDKLAKQSREVEWNASAGQRKS